MSPATLPRTVADWYRVHPDHRGIRGRSGTGWPVCTTMDAEGCTVSVQCDLSSPWGIIDSMTQRAEGILAVSTPSHGGFWLSPERLAEMPTPLREMERWEDADSPWFEEDISACRVVLAFPEVFDSAAHDVALRIMRAWKPDVLAALDAAEVVR